METVYDWITVALFAGLIVLFLQRSMGDHEPQQEDSIWHYLVAGAGCAAVNFLGNRGMHLPAILLLGGTIAFILYILRPFPSWPRA